MSSPETFLHIQFFNNIILLFLAFWAKIVGKKSKWKNFFSLILCATKLLHLKKKKVLNIKKLKFQIKILFLTVENASTSG